MDRWFKTEEGQLVDVVDHCKKELGSKEQLEIYIATDSQGMKNKSVYSTAIVFRYGLRGCHYIHKTLVVPRVKDNFSRLFKEAELTISAAELITKEIPVNFAALEFDYNGRIKTISSPLISASVGWAQSLGYNTAVKPQPMIASKAADHICREESKKIKKKKRKKK